MTNSIQINLINKTLLAIKELYDADILQEQITIQETRKEFEGQLTIVVFPIIRISKTSPEETGKQIGEYLKEQMAEVKDYNVIKGFLNIEFTDQFWIDTLLEDVCSTDFAKFDPIQKKVMVEYSSPNTNKPLHLGHIRNIILGYSVSEILKERGYDVIKTNLINDRGIHINKSMLAWQKYGNGETPESTGEKGDHLVGKYYVKFSDEYKKEIDALKAQGQSDEEAKKNAPLIVEAQQMLQKWEANDEEVVALWKKMNEWVYDGFKVTYENLGVDFDKLYYESNTYLLGKNIINQGLDEGVFFKKPDGSIWVDLTEEGLDEKLVLRCDGTSVYITQDIGTAQLKYDEFGMEKSLYVVGNEQDYHFKVLFEILKKLGKPWSSGMYHLSYGMVDLPNGKMKSREGNVVDADEIMLEMSETAKARTEELGKTQGISDKEKESLYSMIGMGALKYFLLKVEPKKRLLFNPSESVDFQGNTGPFIQYTHARIKSVLRKSDFSMNSEFIKPNSIGVYERELIQTLSNFPETIDTAASEYSPALIANYVYDVAKQYNRFYHEETILKSTDESIKAFRLALSNATANIIARCMQMLGIGIPDRM